MSVLLLSIGLCLSITSTNAVNSLYAVTVGTGVGHNCGMDKSGYIVIELDGLHHEHCTTNRLDNPGDDFEEGDLDVYEGDQLGACLNTDFPDGIFQFRVKHHGSDGWCMDSVSLEFRMGGIVDCKAGVVLDDDQTYTCDG
eukprot:TRINITY_DN4977_c0_g1_i4.p1 TRINITY_DN4977_c0_g1~~TRINITY_DN4977_c0_g1_i4.p1  ORF type:complete len:140 (-),score=21.69 TRINITY_DN4977_c0_g1_i4:60-479(-)